MLHGLRILVECEEVSDTGLSYFRTFFSILRYFGLSNCHTHTHVDLCRYGLFCLTEEVYVTHVWSLDSSVTFSCMSYICLLTRTHVPLQFIWFLSYGRKGTKVICFYLVYTITRENIRRTLQGSILRHFCYV